MLITLEGNQLRRSWRAQSAFPIFPESETMFFLKVVDAQIEFVKIERRGDAPGVASGWTRSEGTRTSDKARSPPRKEIQVSPQLLARYAGRTIWAGLDVTMTVEGAG